MNVATLQVKDNAIVPRLYIAMELSNKSWKVVFSDGVKRRRVTIEAGHREKLREAVAKAKERFHLPEDVRVVSCYEAGRDGFWLHRYLLSIGIEDQVVDSSSIEANRRGRRAKADRIDGDKVLTMVMRDLGGERDVWSVVQVPSIEEEDARRLHRELERLKSERYLRIGIDCRGYGSPRKEALYILGYEVKSPKMTPKQEFCLLQIKDKQATLLENYLSALELISTYENLSLSSA